MRIIQVIQRPQLRGAEIFTVQLSSHLMKRGHEVMIIAIFDGAEALDWKGDFLAMKRPRALRFFDLVAWFRLAKIIRKYGPDIIQANAADTLKFTVLSNLFFRWRVPIVFRNASTISRYIKSPMVRLFNGFLLNQTALILSVSKHSQADLMATFPGLKPRVQFAPIGVETEELVPAAIPRQNYVLHVGGFTFEKNHEGLLRIMARVMSNHSVELWLVGDGPLRPEIEQLAAHLGISDRLKFLGYQRDVKQFMLGARALVLPSLIEGLPAVVLEAMYCKTPVIAYDTGGISEAIESDKTGWLLRSGDEEGFATAVKHVLREDTSDMVESAYLKVTHEFANPAIAQLFIGAYQRTLEARD